MANGAYDRGYYITAITALTASKWRMMLVSPGYTFTGLHNSVYANSSSGSRGEPKVYEISVGGYARQNVTLTAFEDDTNLMAGLDCPDVTFSALVAGQTVGGAVLYRYSSSGGTT